MYLATSFNGADLPAKTLCLTFDDGPGNDTIEIAKFLFEQGIRATFFVVGKYAFHLPNVLLQLKQMNHLIGNHTYDHPDLPYYFSANGDILDQVLRTDVVIKPYLNTDRIYFRAPYGKWSAEVAKELNQNILTANHIGPIYWDVAGVDCYYWQNNWAVTDAVARYLKDIERCDHGIIVMHDDIADMDVVKPRNKTLELIKALVPQLKSKGYRFVGLDEIPSIKIASAETPTFTLRNRSGKYVCIKNKFELWADGEQNDVLNLMQLEDLGYGKFAIKAANNLYFGTDNASDEVIANRPEIGATETFDLIPVNETGLMLRCNNGMFVSIKNKKLYYREEYMRKATVFYYSAYNLDFKTNISLKKRYSLFEKKILFIKSKLQQKLSTK